MLRNLTLVALLVAACSTTNVTNVTVMAKSDGGPSNGGSSSSSTGGSQADGRAPVQASGGAPTTVPDDSGSPDASGGTTSTDAGSTSSGGATSGSGGTTGTGGAAGTCYEITGGFGMFATKKPVPCPPGTPPGTTLGGTGGTSGTGGATGTGGGISDVCAGFIGCLQVTVPQNTDGPPCGSPMGTLSVTETCYSSYPCDCSGCVEQIRFGATWCSSWKSLAPDCVTNLKSFGQTTTANKLTNAVSKWCP